MQRANQSALQQRHEPVGDRGLVAAANAEVSPRWKGLSPTRRRRAAGVGQRVGLDVALGRQRRRRRARARTSLKAADTRPAPDVVTFEEVTRPSDNEGRTADDGACCPGQATLVRRRTPPPQ